MDPGECIDAETPAATTASIDARTTEADGAHDEDDCSANDEATTQHLEMVAKGRLGLLRVHAEIIEAKRQLSISNTASERSQLQPPLDARCSASSSVAHMFQFHLHERSVTLAVELPLKTSTEADELSDHISSALDLSLEEEVVAVTRCGDASFPPLPLLLLHGLLPRSRTISESESTASPVSTPTVQCEVIVRSSSLRGSAAAYVPAPPLESIELAALASEVEGLDQIGIGGASGAAHQLLERLRTHGVARVRGSARLTEATRACLRVMAAGYFEQANDAYRARMHCRIAGAARGSLATSRRYAGFGDDIGREWLQLRRAQHGKSAAERAGNADGDGDADEHGDGDDDEDGRPRSTVLPAGVPEEFGIALHVHASAHHGAPSPLPTGVPEEFGIALHEMRRAATICLRALCVACGLRQDAWTSLTDVVDAVNHDDHEDSTEFRPLGGPSVLRLMRYVPSHKGGKGCTLHADLGLLTLSPAPISLDGSQTDASAGLQVYDVDHQQWRRAEVELQTDELSIFAGEQLAFLTAGRIRAALHRVPAPKQLGRFAMPFFVRAHPHAILVPTVPRLSEEPLEEPLQAVADGEGQSAPLSPRQCEDFVVNELLSRRPWRTPLADGVVPDY